MKLGATKDARRLLSHAGKFALQLSAASIVYARFTLAQAPPHTGPPSPSTRVPAPVATVAPPASALPTAPAHTAPATAPAHTAPGSSGQVSPPPPASGQPASAKPPPPATSPDLGSVAATCIERIPEGKTRPKIRESFPTKGTSGHVAILKLVVPHLKGEEVLPGGFRISESDALQALEKTHLALPDPEGPAGPKIVRSQEGTQTDVSISVVPLPPEPGRQQLTLPPLPISIARANGQVITVCTAPHAIVVEDPTANSPDPKPKPNPSPRRQQEPWELLKQLVYGGLLALVVGVLAAWLFNRWRKRPRVLPPPPPPRPPWEVAIEELHDVRHAGLISAQRHSEHYDRVSDAVRKYLGDRYGYDGLESTTREALTVLSEISPALEPMDKVRAFLRQADLVKFARLAPSEEECELALARGEEIVRSTMPTDVGGAPPTNAPTRRPE